MKNPYKKIVNKYKKIDVLINNAGSKSSSLKNFYEKMENYKNENLERSDECKFRLSFFIITDSF